MNKTAQSLIDGWAEIRIYTGPVTDGNFKPYTGPRDESSITVSYTHLTLPTKRIV